MFSKKLTIFEGCDGSGKSTAAQRFAQDTGARYVHFGNLPRVAAGLARLYAEAMLPAVLGYQDVVLDRCWLSEQPYGTVYRAGSDRIGAVSRRMLERLAMRCGALVVRCDPGEAVCLANWRARQHAENKDWEDDAGAAAVNEQYRALRTELLVVDYDYSNQPDFFEPHILDTFRPACHPLEVQCAGNLYAKIALVGESFAEVKDQDLFYQWPFASFSGQGCSRWLTEQLHIANIRENDLFWCNIDMVKPGSFDVESVEYLIALGGVAHKRLDELGYQHYTVAHPQYAKRFTSGTPYELISLIKNISLIKELQS